MAVTPTTSQASQYASSPSAGMDAVEFRDYLKSANVEGSAEKYANFARSIVFAPPGDEFVNSPFPNVPTTYSPPPEVDTVIVEPSDAPDIEFQKVVVNEIIADNAGNLTAEEKATLDTVNMFRDAGLEEMASFLELQVAVSVVTRNNVSAAAASGDILPEDAQTLYTHSAGDGSQVERVVLSDWLGMSSVNAFSPESFSKVLEHVNSKNPSSNEEAVVGVATVFGELATKTDALGVHDLGIDMTALSDSIAALDEGGGGKEAHIAAIFGAFAYKIAENGGATGMQAATDMLSFVNNAIPTISPLVNGVFKQAVHFLGSSALNSGADGKTVDNVDLLKQINLLSSLEDISAKIGNQAFQLFMTILNNI
jgi:hypothetical protein